jgi:hypothetical protein
VVEIHTYSPDWKHVVIVVNIIILVVVCGLRGETALLGRMAHATTLHPALPNTLLIFGGYRGSQQGWANDLVVIDTERYGFYCVGS